MSNASNRWHNIDQLLDRVLDGLHSEEDSRQLNDILRTDVEACRRYVAYMELHGRLTWGDGIRAGAERGTSGEELVGGGRGMAGSPAIDGEEGFGIRDSGFGIQSSGSLSVGAAVEHPVGAAVEHPVGAAVELPNQLDPEPQIPESRTPNPEPPFPTLSTTHYPLPTSDFVGSWAFSCMVATVIMGVMLLVFWAMKVTHHQHIAEAPSQSVPSETMPEMVFFGRITGMVDVKWSDDPYFLPPLSSRAYVPLGRKYILNSGLLEITYDSGAKVILEGPCTYEVESTAGGYLALGKLTAKVEAVKGKGSRSKVQGSRSKAEPSSFILHPSSLFSVRTPTAVITDLGTEFGVDVSDEGNTESRVFRGSVKVQVVGGTGLASGTPREVILRKNESARVEGGDELRITMLVASAKTADFTRRIPKVTYKMLDLVDVVAGGDGFSGRRNRGIDPTNGQADAMTPKDTGPEAWFHGDGKYHRVEALPLVDGVFIPDGGKDAVQVDSAGNTFAGFPDTTSKTWKPVWAGGKLPIDQSSRATLGGIDYAATPHCLLFMHANNGITFDLEAIRRANPGCKLLRFRAVAGNSSEVMYDPNGTRVIADLWVLVDGQVRFERREINGYSGAFSVSISIGDNDRFLTLATTDGGNQGMYGDWTMFGDPRLDLMQVDANEPKDKRGGD